MDKRVKVSIPSSEQIKKIENCHLMPFEVKYNGKANVSQYFERVIETTEDKNVSASFRGRPLVGERIDLPTEFAGVVIEKNKNTDENEQELQVTGRFEHFTYWNWNKDPSENDKIKQALSWLKISKTLQENPESS